MRPFALAACFVMAALPALADTVTIPTARGEATVPAAPARIAVYDVAAVDTLETLGVRSAGVPGQLLPPYLHDVAAQARPVGTLFEPDLEALSALSPDLIIVGARTAAKYDEVKPLAPTIDMTTGSDLIASLHGDLTAYGTLFGKQAEARTLADALDAKVAAVRQTGAGKGKLLVLMTNGPKLSAFGGGSRFGWLYSVSGLAEAHPGLKTDVHGNAISYEFIAETDPDWIFVLDRGAAVGQEGASAQQTLDNPLVAATAAAKNGHIVYLNPADLYIASGGYQSTMELLGEMQQALSDKE